jgi:hypothetical protein
MVTEFRLSDNVERVRTWAGVLVVVAGDLAIAVASGFMVFRFASNNADVTEGWTAQKITRSRAITLV